LIWKLISLKMALPPKNSEALLNDTTIVTKVSKTPARPLYFYPANQQ
jgi:hypothetical protein